MGGWAVDTMTTIRHTEVLRALVEEVVELLRHVNVLDCGAHHCRYCLAKSPDWDHAQSCPYVESQRLNTRASVVRQELIARLDEALTQRDSLMEALKDIVDDLKARWDMRDQSTNPGIRDNVERAEAAIAKAERDSPDGGYDER